MEGGGVSRRGPGDERLARLIERALELGILDDPGTISPQLLDLALEGFQAAHAAIFLGKGQRARQAVARSAAGAIPPGATLRSLCERTEARGCATLLDGAPAEASPTTPPGTGGAMGVPLRARGTWLGCMLVVGDPQGASYDGLDLRRLAALADLASVAIDDARLVFAHARDQRTLREELDAMESLSRDLELRVRRQSRELAGLRQGLEDTHRGKRSRWGTEKLVGSSSAMAQVRHAVEAAAMAERALLIQGQAGTGKDLTARVYHRIGPGGGGPLVVVPCATIPEDLVASELLGYRAGAFSGASCDYRGWLAQAHGGTLYLDGVEHLTAPVQALLLRVIQERRVRPVGGQASIDVDMRLVASAPEDLPERVRDGRLRQDLYYRLAGVEVKLPSLRERREDIPLLVESLLVRCAGEAASIEHAAVRLLERYPWPGNVRELANEVHRAVLASGGAVRKEHLSPHVLGADIASVPPGEGSPPPLRQVLLDHVLRTMAHTGGNRSETARLLGISRNTLARYLGR